MNFVHLSVGDRQTYRRDRAKLTMLARDVVSIANELFISQETMPTSIMKIMESERSLFTSQTDRHQTKENVIRPIAHHHVLPR